MRRSRVNRRKAPPRQLPKLPPLPRVRINWSRLLGVPVAIGLIAAIAAYGSELVDAPIETLVIEGNFQRVTALDIEAAVEPSMRHSFMRLDLDEVMERVASIDWVDGVELTRIWPNKLRVRFTEHRAAAAWGESGLLNTRGELFAENVRHEYRELPRLSGPDGSHRYVAAVYLGVKDRLADAGLTLETIRMDARGAYEIELASGQIVRVGREDVEGRIDRFFAVALPQLAGLLDRIAYFDMRYPKAFAVGWHDGAIPATDLDRFENSG